MAETVEPKRQKRIVEEEPMEEEEVGAAPAPSRGPVTDIQQEFSEELLRMYVSRQARSALLQFRQCPRVGASTRLTLLSYAGDRYYDRIFPVNLMCRWLSYGTQHDEVASQNLLHRREFSFTTGDDVYIRYLSYEGVRHLLEQLRGKAQVDVLLPTDQAAPASPPSPAA